jgi:hypothetical protein
METSPAVRGAKTTILVKGLPLGRVMVRVANVMRLRWSREGDAYRLVADPADAAREGAFMKSDAETRRKALERELREKAARPRLPFGRSGRDRGVESELGDDYADFAARITDRQARYASEPRDYLLKVSPYALDDGLPILRLWGTLTKAQREILRGGGALAYGALGGTSKAAFAHAVTEVFAGAWHKGPMVSRFVGGTGSYGDWARPFDASFDVSDENTMEPNSEGIRLTLGPSQTDGVQYTVALAGAPQKR